MVTEDAWFARVGAERAAGNLTYAFERVLRAIIAFRGHDGRIFPSHASIAERADCADRTVRRALNQAVLIGLIWWRADYRRDGWRKVRTTNHYVLNVPAAPVKPGLRPKSPRARIGGQTGRVQGSVSKQVALQGMLNAAKGCGDLLLRRREQLHAIQVAQCAARSAWNRPQHPPD
jgi:hypothetical protein